jgi:hypothetical protein
MRLFSGCVWLAFFLAPLWGVGQGDTVFTDRKGTILVRKPDVRGEVILLMDYSVYLKKSDQKFKPKTSKNGELKFPGGNSKGMSFVGDDGNKKATAIEYPLAMEYDQLLADYLYGSTRERTYIDLDKLYDSNLVVYFPPKDLPKVDSVRIVIQVNKQGIYSYSYFSRTDSLKPLGKKALELLTHVKSWYPANIVYYSKTEPNKVLRKKRAHCIIVMTVVLTARDPVIEQMFGEN